MNLSIVFPNDSIPSGVEDAKRWIIEAALQAAQAGLKPVFPTTKAGCLNIKTYVKKAVLAALPPSDSPGRMIAGLANAWSVHQRRKELAVVDDSSWLRPEQKRLISSVEEAMQEDGIVFAEAGTGVGKTIAGITLAVRYVRRTGKPVIIAVPTIGVLAQTLSEYHRLAGMDPDGQALPSLGYLIGRQNFVRPSLMRDFIENPPDDIPAEVLEKAMIWLEDGGKGAPDTKTAPLHAANPDLAWLAEDLQHAAPGFPVDAVRLDEESIEDCPAQAVYQRLRDKAKNAQIVVCTHIMLGIDAIMAATSEQEIARKLESLQARHSAAMDRAAATGKSGQRYLDYIAQQISHHEGVLSSKREGGVQGEDSGGILPNFGMVVVDEAHLLEESIAALRSVGFSPRLVAKEVSQAIESGAFGESRQAAQKLVSVLRQLHDDLVRLGFAQKNKDTVRIDGPQADSAAAGIVMKCARALAEIDLKQIVVSKEVGTIMYPVFFFLKCVASQAYGIWVNFSPRRKFPSISVGPSSVRSTMERIWNRCDHAVLMSASIYLPDACGVMRTSYIASTLSVPAHRTKTVAPVVQPWLYEPVLCETGKNRKDLTPPADLSGDEHDEEVSESMEIWGKAVATEIARIDRSARGGILVLTTSYARIKTIGTHLKTMLPHEESRRVVMQKRATGVRFSHAEFTTKSRAGLRPIWIAAGGAWTGIDISDRTVAPEADFMLTDLVICNLPFGTNRSTTHITRVEKSWMAERDRAALEFKQGIGRLMRRAGLLHRRIHILDPRVWYPRSIYVPFRHILSGYRNRQSC